MKKRSFMYLFLTFIIMFSFNSKSAFAEIGDRSTPYSAWFNYNFSLQQYEWDTPREVELQLFDMYTGEEANEIVANENMYNTKPADDEEWIVMGFNLKYVSGPEEPLYAYDVVDSNDSFYTKFGQKVNPIDTASFSGQLEGLDEYDVELYPGAESEVYYGILVKKTVGYPIIRIGMGYDSRADQTIYGWFSTDPNYVEPILSPTNVKAAASSYNSVKLSWTKADDVTGYEIYRSTSSTGTYTKIATTSSTSYTNTSLNTGTTYYYKIKSYKTGTPTQYSDYSKAVSAKPVLSTPTSVKAVSTTSTSFNNTGLTTNKTYYYKVKSYRIVASKKVYGNYSSIVSAKPIPSVPTNFNVAKVNSTSSKISWSSVSGASGYEIYRSTSSAGSYSLVKRTTSTSYTNSGLTKGKTYYYKVRAYRTVGTTKVYSGWTTIKSVKL